MGDTELGKPLKVPDARKAKGSQEPIGTILAEVTYKGRENV